MGVSSRKLSKDERKSYRDEQRLLQGSQPTRDRRAIPIQPGSIAKKHETFKPTNTIGVRPGTRVNQSSSVPSLPFSRPKPWELDSSTVIPDSDEEVTPPRKRLKQESPKIIDLEEDGPPLAVPETSDTNIIVERSPSRTPVQAQKSIPQIISKYGRIANSRRESPAPVTPKSKPWTGRRADAFSDSENEKPKKRSKHEQTHTTGIDLKDKSAARNNFRDLLRGRTVPAVVVEVPDPAMIRYYPKEIEKRVNRRSSRSDDRHIDDLRESPDELQGNKTVPDTWKEHSGLKREVSPSNIRHTRFTSTGDRKALQQPTEKKLKGKPSLITFDISVFRYLDFSAKPVCRLAYNTETFKFLVIPAGDDVVPSKTRSFDLLRAIKMDYSEVNCGKIRLSFPRLQKPGAEFADIEFPSDQERERFWRFLQKRSPSLKRYSRKREYMEDLFLGSEQSQKNIIMMDKQNSQKSRTTDTESEMNAPSVRPKRLKLSDNLRNGDQPPSNRSIEKLSHAHPSPSRVESSTPIPIKAYQIPTPFRKTRSFSRKQNVEIESEDETNTGASILDMPGKRWQNPLVYPATGKKKAEVGEHDLDRLRPHEFLNDNLIGLYIRFLEHHLERQHPDIASRIYFFNSYFFATLTNTSKGQKGINYQGVEKWTRSVDIFAFDYLVVPINENAHWYVAIICNLPTLLLPKVDNPKVDNRAGSESIGKDEMEMPKTPGAKETNLLDVPSVGGSKPDVDHSPSDATKENQVRESFTSMTLKDDSAEPHFSGDDKEVEHPEIEEWPDEDENQVSHLPYKKEATSLEEKAIEPITDSLKSSRVPEPEVTSKTSKAAKKRGKKGRNPGIRYNKRQPAIIVFDSLDCPRRPTIGILRDYLEEEAKTKRSLIIDSKGIVGLNAKQIPHQPNFSDCGLYLLAYLEKFVQDPDHFVRSVLRKEMNKNKDWPAMKPGLFRSRLRKFLCQLYEEQQALKDGKLGENQLLMADTKSLNILLASTPVAVEDSPATDEDRKESDVLKASPKPAAKHASLALPVTPTRSSPRCLRGEKRTPISKSQKTPKTPVASTVPSSSDIMLLSLSDTTSKQDKLDETEKPSEEIIQVPMTPPPREPSAAVSSSTFP
ncbi:Ulp1 protease [Trichophyton equinum CBS 127.97]|uniref:Ulp1 protease n=1 Tax=Trichophyton equinum (strain ATCC MYA-4606 / CBS 127.97) TaxID=559882 RepID=F2PQ96_TRIEC|nr:Ulp1 protease [Trichophyton equinum CBS 127.97]